MKTPNQIINEEPRFLADAWKDDTLAELAMWVHLLRKRAGMRVEPEKAAKDLKDASNYEAMLRAHLEAGR
jgi:hypothetical protein